ncbi:MAG TPA: hypothetical protein VGM81_09990 [Burkholderiaceae bacterium]
MLHNQAPQGFPAFFVIWAILAIGFSAFFYLNPNAALKRKVWPFAVIAAGLIFIAFVWTSGIPHEGLLFMAPVVALITWINIRTMKFCDACGKTARAQNPFTPPKFCSKCGAPLVK